MRHFLNGFMTTGALIATMISSAAVVHAGGPPVGVVMQPEAKKHFDTGVKAIEANQLEKAEAELLLAWRTDKHYRIAANLGRVEIELRKYRNAAEHLDYCLHNATEMTAEHKAAVEALFNEARAHVGTLDIRTAVPGATILVDGKVVGYTPLAGVFVDPGQRTIAARMVGQTFQEKPIQVSAGKTESVTITQMAPPAAPLQVSPPPPSEPKEQPLNWKYVAVPIGLGVTIAGFAVGIGYTVAMNSPVVEDIPVQQTQVGQTGVVNQVQSENTTGAVIGYAVGGTALLATVIMAVWPTERAQRTAVFVAPFVGGGQGGAVVGGAF